MNSATRNSFLLILLLLAVVLPTAFAKQRAFVSLGVGTGHDIWKDARIPMYVEVTKQENKDRVSETLAKAAAHLAARTCVQFYEVSEPTTTVPYVSVKDDKTGSCSAGYRWSGPSILNYDGCGHQYLTVVHEMMHILGIGHEQKRIDSYDKLKLNDSNVNPDFVSQYTPTFADAYGEYDWNSIMHYGNWGFNNGNGPTYDAIRTGHDVDCKQMSDGDIATVDFVAQSCWKEPMLPRCKVSAPSGIYVGSKFDKNMSFTALYKSERLVPTFTNLPEGAQVHHFYKYFGSVYLVELKPTANDLGKNFTITASYTTSDGKSTSCSIEVKVATSDYVCDNIASSHANVCSGHGVCNSHDFPQCQCEAGYSGPFCQGVTNCPADVDIDMEADQQGRCYIPDDGLVTRVPGPNGEGTAANGTSVYFSLMRDVARQPSEVRALVKFIGGDSGSQSVNFGFTSVYLSNRKLNGRYIDDSWHEFRTVYDWERRRYMEFLDGHWAGDGSITSSACNDLSHYDCALTSIRGSNSGAGGIVQMDRVRMGCDASHVVAMASMQLSAKNRIDNDIALMFLAPHSSYVWDATKLGDLCTATHPMLLTGVTFQVDANDQRRMNLTLPKVGLGTQAPGLNYISCIPQSKHFTNPALPVQAWSQQLFTIDGICSGGETIEYKNMTNQDWSAYPTIPDRVDWLNFSVPLQHNSDWQVDLFNESYKRVAQIRIQPAYKRFRIYNLSSTVVGEDDRFATMTNAVLTLTIDWSTMSTIGMPTLNAKILDIVITQPFNAPTTRKAQMWYWYNSPHGNVTFQYGCNPAPTVTRPPLWPTDITETPTPTTIAPTTEAPTTLAPTTIAPTTEAPTTLAPTTIGPATSAPGTPSTPEPTTAPRKVRDYRVRLGGTSWEKVLTESRAALEASIKVDLGKKLGVLTSRVVVNDLRVGSLIVDFSVTSADESEVELSNATAVAEKLLASDTFPTTKSTYVASGGSEIEDTTAISSVVTNEGRDETPAPTLAPVVVTEAPKNLPDDKVLCARGCQVMILVVVVVVAFMGVAVACLCKKRQVTMRKANPAPFDHYA